MFLLYTQSIAMLLIINNLALLNFALLLPTKNSKNSEKAKKMVKWQFGNLVKR